jgi:hypothetical protein
VQLLRSPPLLDPRKNRLAGGLRIDPIVAILAVVSINTSME